MQRQPHEPRVPRRRRWAGLLRVAGVTLLTGVVLVLYLARVQERALAERKGTLCSVAAEPAVESDGHVEQVVALRSSTGLGVRLALKRPLEEPASAPPLRPLIVLLGGQQTGLDALRILGATRGAIVAVVAYPYDGPQRPGALDFVLAIPRMRQAILDTPPALRLALDWLIELPGVDHSRVELCGVSLGGPFACVAGALEPRFTRVWSIHGAADPLALLEHSLRSRVGWAPLRQLVALALYVLADGPTLAPERYVGRIAPRPFVMLNAEDDERLPRAAVLKLYEAAREPREITWLAGRHIEPGRREIVQQLVDIVLTRVGGARPAEQR